MTREAITVIHCDGCNVTKPLNQTWAHLKSQELDLCPKCLKDLHDAVEVEYRRVIHGQVRDRRGGWRNLGEYDG